MDFGPQPGEILPDLDPEVEEILVKLFEASRSVERPHRTFFVFHTDQSPAATVSDGGLDSARSPGGRFGTVTSTRGGLYR